MYLVLNETTLLTGGLEQAKLSSYLKRQLQDCGVRIINNKQVIRVNTDGAVLHDGSFINCSIVFCTEHERENDRKIHEAFVVTGKNKISYDGYGRVKDAPYAWISKARQEGIMPAASQYIMDVKEGAAIGKNIARSIQNRPIPVNKKLPLCIAGNLGNGKAFASMFGLSITGRMAFCIRFVWLLVMMPSANRNACLKTYFKFIRKRFFGNGNAVVSLSGSRLQLQKVAF